MSCVGLLDWVRLAKKIFLMFPSLTGACIVESVACMYAYAVACRCPHL